VRGFATVEINSRKEVHQRFSYKLLLLNFYQTNQLRPFITIFVQGCYVLPLQLIEPGTSIRFVSRQVDRCSHCISQSCPAFVLERLLNLAEARIEKYRRYNRLCVNSALYLQSFSSCFILYCQQITA